MKANDINVGRLRDEDVRLRELLTELVDASQGAYDLLPGVAYVPLDLALERARAALVDREGRPSTAGLPGADPAIRYDVASTGLDAAVVTTAGYGSDRIAHLRRGEECSPEAWAAFKRWLADRADPAAVLVDMAATLPNGHHEKPGILRAIEMLRSELGGAS